MISFQEPYLRNTTFLKQIDQLHNKELYINIILLDWNENFIKEIHGSATGGSINIDGGSSMRTTANIQMSIKDDEYVNYDTVDNDFSINKKVKLEIGIKNTTNTYVDYPIIWFPFGVFIITGLSISHNLTAIDVSLTLNDKMCLLNGTCGGILPASVAFDEREEYNPEKGTYEINKVRIFNIIQELVNHFGQEQLGRILINDVPLRIKQVMKWAGDIPIYISQEASDPTTSAVQYSLEYNEEYNEYGYGEDIGYIYTDFVYPGELVGDAGSTVCDILDKIKNTLGNYEYFYDVYGNFVFREIRNYLNTTQATFDLERINSSNYLIDMNNGKSVYNFSDSTLIQSYNNVPNLNNIKNDFMVWGIRKTVDGMELPIRYHLAIDKKPEIGVSRTVTKITDGNGDIRYLINADTSKLPEGADTFLTTSFDWRTELLLQGAEAEQNGTDTGFYYAELLNEWEKIYDIKNGEFNDKAKYNSQSLDFYLDFIDVNSSLGQYNVDAIGRRSKVIVDDKINCLFEPEIPDVCFIKIGSENYIDEVNECKEKGQKYCQVDEEIYNNIQMGGVYNGAYTLIKDLLYQYTNYNESITLQTLPIYYLEPNSRISVFDQKSGIAGDYVIKSMSIPLSVGSTMNINANRVLTKI